jgi:hypothetical protein
MQWMRLPSIATSGELAFAILCFHRNTWAYFLAEACMTARVDDAFVVAHLGGTNQGVLLWGFDGLVLKATEPRLAVTVFNCENIFQESFVTF